MPQYAKFDGFMKRVRARNPTFRRIKSSSLDPLIAELNKFDMSASNVRNRLAALPTAKVLKYQDAIYYLLATYPEVRSAHIQWGALVETNAALFRKTLLPSSYDPASRDKTKRIVKGTPPNAYLDQTCEQFLLDHPAKCGVILIHLESFQPPMNDVYRGYKVVDHINSVLRVAAALKIPVCALHMNEAREVSAELAQAYGKCVRQPVFRGDGHMGSAKKRFRDFAEEHKYCVVMGFDGTICVHANIFGAPEYGKDDAPLRPLITLTNVVTSRCVLVNGGQLYPKDWQQEYGVLEGT